VGFYVNSNSTQETLAEAWNGTAWRIQSTPNPRGATASYLWGVACTAATACTAVGDYTSSDGSELSLAEHWNGTSWTIQNTPAPSGASIVTLTGVSCTSASACTAVGSYETYQRWTLAERWNGSAWTIQSTPFLGGSGSLNRVSCTSTTACIAVGENDTSPNGRSALAEGWDGSTWTIQTTPSGTGTLNDVSCSLATACTAVGNSFDSDGYHALAERWDGTAWTTQTISDLYNGYVYGVSCASATTCIVVGSDPSVTLAWNGAAWSADTNPADGGLNGVSCTSITECTAVGSNRVGPLAEHWNGSTWKIQAAPIPYSLAFSTLSGVSCASTVACTAVGNDFDYPGGETQPMAQHWDGTSWKMQRFSNEYGTNLRGVSCTSSTACMAVGLSPVEMLAERWNGSTWELQSTPHPSPDPSYGVLSSDLNGVSCRSATACTAVGDYSESNQYGGSNATWKSLAERWNGSTWTIQTTPRGGNNETNNILSGVSCPSATVCIAVGYSGAPNERLGNRALAERWDGSTWAALTTPNPTVAAGLIGSGLGAVSCTTPSACTAVGYHYVGTTQEPLAERWNGTTWVIQTTPKPSGGGTLTSVSCTAANACTAVGSSNGAPLAARWNGSTWTLQSIAKPRGATSSTLNGVSCSSVAACTAVGFADTTDGIEVTLAERYSG
jgi:hypothetical protein